VVDVTGPPLIVLPPLVLVTVDVTAFDPPDVPVLLLVAPEAVVPVPVGPELVAPEAVMPEAVMPEAVVPEAVVPEAVVPASLSVELLPPPLPEFPASVPRPPVDPALVSAAEPPAPLVAFMSSSSTCVDVELQASASAPTTIASAPLPMRFK